MSTGVHSIRHQNNSAVLGVSVYGFDTRNSYGYPGGMRLSPIQCNCGQNSICLNNMGQFNCSCLNGFLLYFLEQMNSSVTVLSVSIEALCNNYTAPLEDLHTDSFASFHHSYNLSSLDCSYQWLCDIQ